MTSGADAPVRARDPHLGHAALQPRINVLTCVHSRFTILVSRFYPAPTEGNGGLLGDPVMTFQIGEKVVYPNQGVGTIENIRAWALGSQFEQCYLLRMVYGSVTVTVPFSKVANIGLRPITKNTEISRVLS